MSKSRRRTESDIQKLKTLYDARLPIYEIAHTVGRAEGTHDQVYSRISSALRRYGLSGEESALFRQISRS